MYLLSVLVHFNYLICVPAMSILGGLGGLCAWFFVKHFKMCFINKVLLILGFQPVPIWVASINASPISMFSSFFASMYVCKGRGH